MIIKNDFEAGVQRVQKVQRVQRVVVGGCAANLYKTFTTALAGERKSVPPLVAGATTFAPVGSVSLDSQSPKGSLRIQFPCHPASGGTMNPPAVRPVHLKNLFSS